MVKVHTAFDGNHRSICYIDVGGRDHYMILEEFVFKGGKVSKDFH